MSNEYNILIKVRNNYLLELMNVFGFNSANKLSKATGITPGAIGDILNLKTTVYNSRGEVRSYVKRLAEYFNVAPELLFPPDQHYKSLENNIASINVSAEQMTNLISSDNPPFEKLDSTLLIEHLKDNINLLTCREQRVINLLFGLDGCKEYSTAEVAEIENVCYQRIGQIKDKAIRKLKHPARMGAYYE